MAFMTAPLCAAFSQTDADAALAGSKRANSRSTAPAIQVYPTETIVDVSVTDENGNPVHGLRQSNFTVEEDGHPRAIRSFHEFAHPLAPAQEPSNLPPNTYTNRRGADHGVLNILLLDFTHLTSGGGVSFLQQVRARQAAEQYLRSAEPGTRFAVLLLTSSHLRIVQNFTSDSSLLSAAVHTIDLRAEPSVGSEPPPQSGNNVIQALTLDEQNRATLEALNQIAASVASIQGRKNLIWFTEGVAAIDDPTFNSELWGGVLPDYLRSYHQTLALLQAAQITVYPISSLMLGLDHADTGPPPMYDSHAVNNLSLDSLAAVTGGVAYYNTNDLAGAVAKAVQAGADYYTLTYIPPDTKFDGRHHTIRVHANIPGVHLIYRDGYYAENPGTFAPVPALAFTAASPEPVFSDEAVATAGRTPQKPMVAAFHDAMATGMPVSTQLLFDVHIEPTTAPTEIFDRSVFGQLDRRYKSKPLTRYIFRSSLQTRELALRVGPDLAYHGAVDFSVAAFDKGGKLVTVLTQTLQMRLGDYGYKQLLDGPVSLEQQIDLPIGQQLFLRVGILDRTSGKIGAVEFPLIAQPYAQASPAQPASPPLVPTSAQPPSERSSEPAPTLQRRQPSQLPAQNTPQSITH